MPGHSTERFGNAPTLEPVEALPADPVAVAAALADRPGLVFLDSSAMPGGRGAGDRRPAVSIVSAEPARILRGRLDRPGDVSALADALARRGEAIGVEADLGIPLGACIGWVDYDGTFAFGEYGRLLVFDHASRRWFASGRGPGGVDARDVAGRLPPRRPAVADAAAPPRLAFRCVLDRGAFVEMVTRAREFIAAGDIYQVNLSRRFSAERPAGFDPFAFYRRLRSLSPAPQAAFLDLGGRTVCSSSPELFLRMSGRSILTRPIKGTRPRFGDPDLDEKSAYDLITSAKEIAELVMITDLERNDLGQVCEFGSVRAAELLVMERFEQVFHLVSTVCGTLRGEVGHLEALRRCFPGGSITGAPKKRAMEIIAELEPVPRGLYTGAIGFLGFNGESQFSIAIRTALVEEDVVHFHSGAGIVADSVPEAEFDETLHKARGILLAGEGGPGPD